MATLLTLCERLRLEAGIPIPAIAALAGASDDVRRIQNWVADAWRDIELMDRDWKWMRRQVTAGVTLAGGGRWTPTQLGIAGGAIHRWCVETAPTGDGEGYSLRCWDPAYVAGGEWKVRQMDLRAFEQRFLVGPQQAASPQFWAQADNGDLLIGPAPDRNYTLRADYVRAIQELAADADQPGCPATYHLAPMWKALYTYAVDDASPEIIARARQSYNALESALLRDQGARIAARFGALGR